MRNLTILSLVLLLNGVCGSAQTEAQKKLISETLKFYPDHTQVAFALIENGKTGYYGVQRENDSLIMVENSSSVFEIGSITKVFTSTLLADFVIDGKVKLDDPINGYIRIPLKDSIRFTFKQLANHTSGLPRMPADFAKTAMLTPDNPFKNYDNKKLEEYLSTSLKLENEPGKVCQYSNLGAGLLGYVLCEISGEDYQTLLKKMIFSKHGMTSSTTRRDEVGPRLVKGLDGKGKETSNWDLAALVGAGGILSTVEDLSRFALAQFDTANKELELTRVKTWFDSQGLDLGLGWHVVKSKIGAEWYWHNGGTGGYTTSMAIDMNRQNGIIILTNISAFNENSKKIDELCFALMKTLKQ